MIKTDRYNNLPKKVLSAMPKLKKREVFELIGIDIKNGVPVLPVAKGVPPTDMLMVDGEIFEIANIARIGSGKEPELDSPFFRMDQVGRITCNPQVPSDHLLFEYLCLSNYNKSNQFRDTTKTPFFRLINEKEDAQEQLLSEFDEGLAVSRVHSMTMPQMEAYAALVGIPTEKDVDVLRLRVLRAAKKNPAEFHKADAMVNELGEHVTLIRQAIDAKVIEFTKTGSWEWSATGTSFFKGNSGWTKAENIKALAEFLRSDKDGKKVAISMAEALPQK